MTVDLFAGFFMFPIGLGKRAVGDDHVVRDQHIVMNYDPQVRADDRSHKSTVAANLHLAAWSKVKEGAIVQPGISPHYQALRVTALVMPESIARIEPRPLAQANIGRQ